MEEEPVYMDVEALRPSPSCQQRRKKFITGKLEQSWPTVILSTNMTFRRKLEMQNCLVLLTPMFHALDPLYFRYMRQGRSIPNQ